MENNLRLNATNKMLKSTNRNLLDQAVVSILIKYFKEAPNPPVIPCIGIWSEESQRVEIGV